MMNLKICFNLNPDQDIQLFNVDRSLFSLFLHYIGSGYINSDGVMAEK